jgi:3-oxoacyl-[acyl-carrier protein] reductase
MKLNKKVAIITGAARGLGKAIAVAFAEQGARVMLMDLDAEELKKTADAISRINGNVLIYAGDVSQESRVLDMVEKTRKQFGFIDILVNNAGIIGPADFIKDADSQSWQKTLDINLNGAYFCIRAVIKHMIAQKSGKIINITSGLGERPFARFCAYGVSKAGLIQMTRLLSEELKAHNIQVNAINPGVMDTSMQTEIRGIDISSMGQEVYDRFHGLYENRELQDPAELSPLAVFLASSDSDHLTGYNLRAEGYKELGWEG